MPCELLIFTLTLAGTRTGIILRQLGWRLYATNAPAEELSLAEAVWAYRGAPQIDRDFRRLKGRPPWASGPCATDGASHDGAAAEGLPWDHADYSASSRPDNSPCYTFVPTAAAYSRPIWAC